jgi:hypothetical protein
MNDKSSYVKVLLVTTKQLVITKQLKLYFNNSARIPTQIKSEAVVSVVQKQLPIADYTEHLSRVSDNVPKSW